MSQVSSLAVESDSSTPKVVFFVALALALVAAVLLKDSRFASAAALVGVAGAFALLILGASRESSAEVAPADDGAHALIAAIERNRAEYARHLAELRKAVDTCKTDEAGARESAAVRAEIVKLRAEVTKLG